MLREFNEKMLEEPLIIKSSEYNPPPHDLKESTGTFSTNIL